MFRQLRPFVSSLLRAGRSRGLCSEVKASKDEIRQLVENEKVVLFMKGSPDNPMCGFSRIVCKVLEMHQVPFSSYDVLEQQKLRVGVKEFSDWPTIPQLFVDGEFVGGSDILVEMHQTGELPAFFQQHGITSKYADQDQ